MIVVSLSIEAPNFRFFGLNAAGLEGKVTQRLYCSKERRKDTFLWLATGYGGYDYGNLIRVLQSCSQYSLGAILCMHN